jgi:Fe-S cluster assembly protein SufB/Fe-S cluster assembly protein SufD
MSEQLLGDFNEHAIRELSSSLKEPEWLLRFRLRSFENFLSLPPETNPLYTKYTYISQFNVSDFPFGKIERDLDFRDTFKGYLVGNETNISISANNQIMHTELEQDLEKKGIIITSIEEAIKKYESKIKDIFSEKIVKSEDEKFAAFVNSFFNTGLFIYVPRGLRLEKPLRKLRLTDKPETSTIDQTIVFVEEDSSLLFLEEEYSKDEEEEVTLHASNLDVFGGRNTSVDLSSIHMLGEKAVSIVNRGLKLDEGARMTDSSLYLGSAISRARTNFFLAGRGSFAEGFEIFFTDGKQRYDFETNLVHLSQDSTGSTHARGVLRGESQSIYKGMIKIDEAAKNSRSYLAHHAMILERTARSDAIPGLEIYTNEVKATHSASVAQLDEEQLFYLMSRGIEIEEAKKMIVLGFFEPVLSRVPVEETREGARFMVEGKWHREKRKLIDRARVAVPKEVRHELKQEDIFERHYKYR